MPLICRTLLVALLLASSGAPKVAINISTPHPMVGSAIRITCRVVPDERNRVLKMGIEPYLTDAEELNSDRITFQRTYEHIPCWAEAAFCAVVNEQEKVGVASIPLEVVGCGE